MGGALGSGRGRYGPFAPGWSRDGAAEVALLLLLPVSQGAVRERFRLLGVAAPEGAGDEDLSDLIEGFQLL